MLAIRVVQECKAWASKGDPPYYPPYYSAVVVDGTVIELNLLAGC